jgi:eukaryotic-like serine/threonine-protein kinase
VERVTGYYRGGHLVDDYFEHMEQSQKPDVDVEVEYRQTVEWPPDGVAPRDQAWEVNYRATANAKVLVPKDAAAQDQTRSVFARVLPYGEDLWVVSLTVPIDQEDSGSRLFADTVPNFQVTG